MDDGSPPLGCSKCRYAEMGCTKCLAIRMKFLEMKKAEKVKVLAGHPIKKKTIKPKKK